MCQGRVKDVSSRLGVSLLTQKHRKLHNKDTGKLPKTKGPRDNRIFIILQFGGSLDRAREAIATRLLHDYTRFSPTGLFPKTSDMLVIIRL